MNRTWTVSLILLINVVVFIAWLTPSIEHFRFMERNFTVSWIGLADGRYWTILTSVFSHNMLLHLLVNMFVLQSFGSILERYLGAWTFLKFYLLAGIVGSTTHALLSNFYLGLPEQAALGASGAIAGLVLLFSMLFPREKILLFAIIPMPAIVGAILFIGLDIWGLTAQAKGGGLPIGHGAHLGGAACGIIYYFRALRGRRRHARVYY